MRIWKLILMVPACLSILSCGSSTDTTEGLTVAIVPKTSVVVPGKTKSCDAIVNAKDADVTGPRVSYRQVMLKWDKNQPLYIVDMKFVFKNPPTKSTTTNPEDTKTASQTTCSLSVDEMNALFSTDANYVRGGEIKSADSGALQILSNVNCNWHCSGFPINFDQTYPVSMNGSLKILAYTVDASGNQSAVRAETPVTADYYP
jgi:hypothetical protein